MAETSATKLKKAEEAFVALKAKYQADEATETQYRNAKNKLRDLRADYRENVRDRFGFSPVQTGD